MIKHSVGIVCYNQAEFIDVCINSLLTQSELPYEIVICDDSSSDETWNLVKLHQSQHPNIIKAYRNEQNLGLFENIAKVKSLLTGEVTSIMGGDDYYQPETIASVNNAIRKHGLSGFHEKFIIVLNSGHLYPDGRITLWNNYRYRESNLVALRLRFGLSYRGVGLSSALVSLVPSETEILLNSGKYDFGYGADWVKGFEEIIQAQKVVFVNTIGPIYRLGSGVTTKAAQNASSRSKLELLRYIGSEYKGLFDWKDRLYIKNTVLLEKHRLEGTGLSYIRALSSHVANIWNYNNNYPWYRELKTFVPPGFLAILKYKVYPRLRKTISTSEYK